MEWLGSHWLDIVGWGGSALLVFSLLQSRVLRFRVLNLVACAILVLFNALVGVWPMVGMNAVLCVINLWFIVPLLRQRHDETAWTVLRVGPEDSYLAHVLRVHRDDITRFQPDLTLPLEPARERHAFLVQHGDETVGVVLLSVRGTTAHVELDWVSPRFRDFSPGEFVWRRSGLLEELGVGAVVTAPSMVEPYYDRLGFRPRADGSWELSAAEATPI